MKHRILTTGILLLITALLLAAFSPCLVLHANAMMGRLTLEEIPEYEAFFKDYDPPIEKNFVTYDMVSCLGEFDYFCFGLKEGNHPEVSDNFDIDYANYDYYFTNGNGFGIRSTRQNFERPLAVLTDGMQDMRSVEQKIDCRIQHNGLEYVYIDGILTVLHWEYADLQFVLYFDSETIKTENGYEVIRTEDIDMSHPIIGKLLSRDEKDVKEGLNLLYAHMYKNGFLRLPIIIGVSAILTVVALAVFLILRSRRKKRNAAPCTVPADTESPADLDQHLPPAPDTP